MKPNDIIQRLGAIRFHDTIGKRELHVLELAGEYIMKSVPALVTQAVQNRDGYDCLCPTCHSPIHFSYQQCCSNCGQRLKYGNYKKLQIVRYPISVDVEPAKQLILDAVEDEQRGWMMKLREPDQHLLDVAQKNKKKH